MVLFMYIKFYMYKVIAWIKKYSICDRCFTLEQEVAQLQYKIIMLEQAIKPKHIVRNGRIEIDYGI